MVTAFRAISLLRSGVRDAARATPPLLAPSFESATACGFFFTPSSYLLGDVFQDRNRQQSSGPDSGLSPVACRLSPSYVVSRQTPTTLRMKFL